MKPLFSRHAHAWLLGLLAAFVALGAATFAGRTLPRGDDLASSYLGCRLLAHGQGSHLFSWDEDKFSDTGDDDAVWDAESTAGGYLSYHHPYVQTPLWAWSLRPLCVGPWLLFERIFLLLALLAFAGCAWLVARTWSPTPRFAVVLTAVLLLWLWFSEPFQYAMCLAQTHVFFVLLTLAALVLAQRNRPVWAGLALALAAGIKVTPAVFVLYWLCAGRHKAAVSALLFSAALLVAGWVITGPALMHSYLATLARSSHTLLLSLNNQSLAAWWMSHSYPRDEAARMTIYLLPTPVRLLCGALLVALACLGGWLDRAPGAAPGGAMLVLLASTALAPIAWTHYGIVLYAPLFVLCVQLVGLRWWPMLLAALAAALLNVVPFTPELVHQWWPTSAPLRSQFYAFTLTMGALAATSLALRRRAINLQPARG